MEVSRVGAYEVVRELGRGGMGVVYEAQHPKHGRVAVKVLLELSRDQLARFETEARACAGLDHPNIVKLLDLGRHHQHPYLVMEFLDGKDLSGRTLSVGEACRHGLALARALQHAHDRRVLHRDIKPANIVLTKVGRPVLIDFGLARDPLADLERLTRTGQMLGTPSYMSPEQANGEVHRIGPKTDVYGLGATLFALTTGEAPFTGPNFLQIIQRVLEQPASAPSTLNDAIDPEFDAICLKCLEKDPDDRYRSAGALAQDLERYMARDGSGSPRSVAAGPARSRSLAVLAGIVGLVLGAVAAGLSPWTHERPTAPNVSQPPLEGSASLPEPPPQPRWEADLELAIREMDARRWAEAHAALERVVAAKPDNYEAWLLRGDAHISQFILNGGRWRYGSAYEALTHATRLDPQDPRAYALRSYVVHRPAGAEDRDEDSRRAWALGGEGSALALCAWVRLTSSLTTLGSADPQSNRRLQEDSLASMSFKKMVAAKGRARHWLGHQRADSLSRLATAGLACGDLNTWESALERLRVQADAQPYPQFFTRLYWIHKARVGKWGDRQSGIGRTDSLEEALRCLDTAIDMEPNYPNALRERGYTRYYELSGPAEGRDSLLVKGAVMDVRRALRVDPDDPHTAWVAGLVIAGSGDVAGAIECWERAVLLQPGHVDAWKNIVGAFWRSKDSASTADACRRALEALPPHEKRRKWFRDALSDLDRR
jgi:tetratricopeptide (TPR) repeat protein/predicted Ser/Thr protein kinase